MFEGQTSVITGAGSGIGRALAQQLAVTGARLALSDVNAAALDETLRLLPAGTEARGYALDVADRAAVFAHAADVERDFGAAHFVFNNAGTTLVGNFVQLDIDEIEWQLAINLWGVIYGCKAFLPGMLARREGCLVNVSSVFGLIGFPLQSAYNISKFGVRGLTECLWQELEGTDVRAVCVHPGGIRTNIEKSGRRSRNAGALEEELSRRADKELSTPPGKCAADILAGLAAGRRRILTGNRAQAASWLARLLPDSYPAVLRRVFA